MKRFPLDKNGGELEIRRLIDVGDFRPERGSERDARAPREQVRR